MNDILSIQSALLANIEPRLKNTSLGRELYKIVSQNELISVFQPIVSHITKNIFAYEALIRGPFYSSLHHPLHLLKVADDHHCLCEIDILARIVSIKSFSEQFEQAKDAKLFLNISANAVINNPSKKSTTIKALEYYGVPTDQVVIEITELQPVEDFTEFYNSINHYRDIGFKVAVDDLGSGYNGLRIWSELKPDFVKIDRHFITDIHKNNDKRHFIETILTLAKGLKTQVIVEGVETEEELKVLSELGAHYFQGYLFQKPNATIDSNLVFKWPKNSQVYQAQTDDKLSEIIKLYDYIAPDDSVESATKKFQQIKQMDFLPVVENEIPIGMVWRRSLMELLAQRFGQDLHGRKSIKEIMDKDSLIVSSDKTVVELSRMITDNEQHYSKNAFIVEKDGKYIGCASFNDLLKKITDLKVLNARHSNPLSNLPGNVPIQQTIRSFLDKHQYFEVIYVDVDHFKPYNDYYSFEKGDDVIRLIARVLKDAIKSNLNEEKPAFLGHIGGDDFVVILSKKEAYQQFCKPVLTTFQKEIISFYDKKDQEKLGIQAVDRKGLDVFFPIMTLSLGVLLVQPGVFSHTQELASHATKAKKGAKSQIGNTCFVKETLKATQSTNN